MHLFYWYSKSHKHLDKIYIISNTLANFATYYIIQHYDDYSWQILGKNIEIFSSYKDFNVQTGFLRKRFQIHIKKIGPIKNFLFFDFDNSTYWTFRKYKNWTWVFLIDIYCTSGGGWRYIESVAYKYARKSKIIRTEVSEI